MYEEQSLEALQARFEKLVLHRTDTLTEAHRRGISNRFDKITLQEMLQIVRELDDPRTL